MSLPFNGFVFEADAPEPINSPVGWCRTRGILLAIVAVVVSIMVYKMVEQGDGHPTRARKVG